MLEERPAYLLEYILFHPSLTVQRLSEMTALSRRQIDYDVSKINDWLKTNNLPAICLKGGQPFQLADEVKNFLMQKEMKGMKQIYFSEDIREFVVYLYLFIRKEAISTKHLNELLKISRNTSMAVIKKTNKYAKLQQIQVIYTRKEGYHLQGTEMDKRVVAQQCVSELLKRKNGLAAIRTVLEHWRYFNNLPHDKFNASAGIFQETKIAQKMLAIQQRYQLTFVEERLHDFQHFLPFYFCRIKQEKFISYLAMEKRPMLDNKLFRPAKELLEQEHSFIPENEIAYMVTHLLGLSLGDTNAKEALLFSQCEQMLTDFENRTCTNFQDREQILHNLYQHFKPAFYRIIHRIPIRNPLMNEIKQEHGELLTIVKNVLIPVENRLQMTFPEDEIGYLTIHFGALLENPLEESVEIQAAIVCPSGISTCLMLKKQLTSLFQGIHFKETMSVKAFHDADSDSYDMVFSTVTIRTDKPLFVVKPVMTSLDKSLLKQEVQTQFYRMPSKNPSIQRLVEEVKKHAVIQDEQGLRKALQALLSTSNSKTDRGLQPLLDELITADMIQIKSSAADWQAAIHLAAEPLLSKKKIGTHYPDAIINKVKEFGPYIVIGPGIALPHARPEDGVYEIGMSLLVLKEPVIIADHIDNPVHLFICIAATDNSTHLKAMTQLTKLLTEKENQQKLITATTKAEILSLVRTYT